MTKKLLLADDSVTIQRVIGIIFATEDYQLLVTDNGDDAYEKAEQELPDLVIADVSMPGKDGFELCRSLKSDPRFVQTSVMLLPGTFDHFDEERAQEAGADGWLAKPFESQALLDKVEQLLQAEPVRLATAESPPAEEAAEGLSEPVLDEPAASLVPPLVEPVMESSEELAVDEATLGLAQVEETAAPKVEEGSAEDIWDAVSFDEEDLEQPAAVAEEESVDISAAESAAEPVFEEPVPDEIAEPTEAAERIEEAPAEDFGAAGETELVGEEPELEVEESFFAAAAEDHVEIEESATLGVADEAAELMDLGEEEVAEQPEAAPLEAPEEPLVEDLSAAEPQEWGAAPEPALSSTFAEPVAEEPELSEEEPLELSEDLVAEEPAEEILELEEPLEELSEPEEEGGSLAEVVAQPESEFAEDEEVLDLAEDDILEEEPLPEAGADFSFDEAAGLAEEEPEEVAYAAQPEELAAPAVTEPEESFAAAEEPSPEAAPAEPLEEPALAEEIHVEPEVAEDEDFFFDASAAEQDEQEAVDLKEEVAAVAATGLAAGAVAAATASEDQPAAASIDQVERQLRELSEDELKDVVAKVAGPLIEKLANEMLEQIAWEVVPDLAESMIREEIRKIKQGAE